MQIADLHIHSHYSRATSKDMTIEGLAKNAAIKGIDILGTGDFTHPKWLSEIRKKLSFNDGIYDFDKIKFIPSGEISLIYKQDGKSRRVHHLILAPSFDIVDQINEWLDKKGRRDYDGRPIFGFSSIEFADEMMKISEKIEIIPAHVWTPWYSIFGSMSGFDSLKECFREKTKYIHAIETGLSSDPLMNWRVSFLDDITLVSNSDSHSPYPYRLGREANAFDLKKITYDEIISSIRTKNNFLFTVEVDPSYGKYHFDGHRNCNFSCAPEESKKLHDICPGCGSKLIIGVLNRVEEMADRKEGFMPKGAVPYKSLIPLSELIAFTVGTAVFSKKVDEAYSQFIMHFGNELNILLNAEHEELKRVSEKIADIIIKNREGKLKIIPGYDGVYGKITLDDEEIKADGISSFKKKSRTLKDFG